MNANDYLDGAIAPSPQPRNRTPRFAGPTTDRSDLPASGEDDAEIASGTLSLYDPLQESALPAPGQTRQLAPNVTYTDQRPPAPQMPSAEDFLGEPQSAEDFLDTPLQRESGRRLAESGRMDIGRGVAPTMELQSEPLPEPGAAPRSQFPPLATAAMDAQLVAPLVQRMDEAEKLKQWRRNYAPNEFSEEYPRYEADLQAIDAQTSQVRDQFRQLGMEDADIDRRIGDLRALTPATAARLSDGMITVNPGLVWDAAKWEAAARSVGGTEEQVQAAMQARVAMREDLSPELDALASRSSAYMNWLRRSAQAAGFGDDTSKLYDIATEGDLLEQFYAQTGVGFGNTGSQTSLSVQGALSGVGQGAFGLADMLTPDAIDPFGLGSFADEARRQGDETSRIREAVGGGWWAKRVANLAGAAVGTMPAFLGAPAGLAGMAAVGGGMQAGQTYTDALAAGYSTPEAFALGTGSGLVEAGITRAFGATGLESLATAPGKGGLTGRVTKGMLSEQAEETMQLMGQIPFQRAIDPDYMPTAEEFLDTNIAAGLFGAAGSLRGEPTAPQVVAPEPENPQPSTTNSQPATNSVDLTQFSAPAGTVPAIVPAPAAAAPAPITATATATAPTLSIAELAAKHGVAPELAATFSPNEWAILEQRTPGSTPHFSAVEFATRSATARANATAPQAATPPVTLGQSPASPPQAAAPTEQAVVSTEGTSDTATESASTQGATSAPPAQAPSEMETQLAARSETLSPEDKAAYDAAQAEYQAELLAQADEHQQSVGRPLNVAVQLLGGLPAPGSAAAGPYSGELATLESALLEAHKGEVRGNKTRTKVLNEVFSADADPDVLINGLREQGFDVNNLSDVAELLADGYARGKHWQGTGNDLNGAGMQGDTPFSQQPAAPTVSVGHAKSLTAKAEALMRKMGLGKVRVVQTLGQLPDVKARQHGRQTGNLIEAYLAPDGSVVLNLDHIARVAKRRGQTPEIRVRQLLIHEAVGHGGIAVLFAGRLADWHAQTERLFARLKDSVFSAADAKRLGYTTLRELATLYGFDLATKEGRAGLIEEHIARVAEAGIKPAWWTAIVARIKDALKRLGFGPGATTDDEIARLLSLARRASRRNATGAPEGAPAQDSRQSLDKPTRAEDVRLADRATEAIRPTNSGSGSGDARRGAVIVANQGRILYAQQPDESGDADYMAAVERGDMETAQRMYNQAAERAGYKTDAFHGTWRGGFTEFKEDSHFSPKKEYADRFQSTSASSLGMSGLKTPGKAMTYSVKLKLKNPLDTRKPKHRAIFQSAFLGQYGNGTPLSERGLPDWTDGIDLMEWIRETGQPFDGVILDEGAEPTSDGKVNVRPLSYVPLSPSQIKSADPVTRDESGNIIPLSQRFNERSNDIRFAQQPAERAIERALLADPDDLKPHGLTDRMRGLLTDRMRRLLTGPDAVQTMATGLYATYTDAAAIADATRWLGERTEEQAIRELLSLKDGQGDKLTFTAAQLMVQRLHERGEHTTAGLIAQNLAAIATTFGQAIQSLHMMLNLADEAAVLAFVQKEFADAAKAKITTPEGTAAAADLDNIKGKLETAAVATATRTLDEQAAAIGAGIETGQTELAATVSAMVDAAKGTLSEEQRKALQDRIDELDIQLRLLQQTSKHELGKTQAELDKVRKQLDEARKALQTAQGGAAKHLAQALAQALAMLNNAQGLTEERKAELLAKMRRILTTDDGSQTTIDRLKGVLVAAGMKPPAAAALAKRVAEVYRKRQQKVRDALLRQLAQGAAQTTTAKLPKGELDRWIVMNDKGLLDDATLFGGIAKQWGFPTFTNKDAATAKDFVRRYNATNSANVRIAIGAEMMDWLHSHTTPATKMDKFSAIYRLTKLMSFKTLFRIIGGNTAAALLHTAAIDLPRFGITTLGVVVGAKYKPLQTAIGATIDGIIEAAHIFREGKLFAEAEGKPGVVAGLKTLLAVANAHTNSVRDAADLKRMAGSVFSSRAMRGFEKFMHFMLAVPDYPRFAGEVKQSLARSMQRDGTQVPTAEHYERAYLDAQRSAWLNHEKTAKVASTMVKALNLASTAGMTSKFGAGTIIAPFTTVPANLLTEGAKWTPLGFVQAIYEGARDYGTGEQRTALNTVLKASVGTAALGKLGAYLFALGILTAGDDDDRDVQKLRELAGWQRYSVNASELKRRMLAGDWFSPARAWQDGDAIESIMFLQPAAMALAAGAEKERLARKYRSEAAAGKPVPQEGWWTELAQPAGGALKAFSDQPLATGFATVGDDIKRALEDNDPAQMLALYTRSLDIVPAIVRDLRYGATDSLTENRHSNAVVAELNRIVGGVLPSALPQRYDVLGRAQHKYDAARSGWLNAIFNPLTERIVRQDPLVLEALRLHAATGDKGTIPRDIKTKVEIAPQEDPRTRRTLLLNTQQIADYKRLTGQLTALGMTDLMTHPQYTLMSDASRAKFIGEQIAAAHSAAKIALFGDSPWNISPASQRFDHRAAAAYTRGVAAGIIRPK